MYQSRYIILFSMMLVLLAGCTKQPVSEVVDDPRVIILMYHRITSDPATNLYERNVADFEKDLQYLRQNNIEVIDLDELDRIVSGDTVLKTHAAVITFDDGDHSWLTLAVPLLKQYHMKAVFFLWTSRMGMNSFLSWDEINLISNYTVDGDDRPFTFGSHTVSHAYLMTKKESYNDIEAFEAYLDEELGGSKQVIESHIYGTVDALSLPYGDGAGDTDIIAAAQKHGYRFIRTSERNYTGTPETDLFRLPSLPVLDDTQQEQIGGYLGI